jgi:hypothetical protein
MPEPDLPEYDAQYELIKICKPRSVYLTSDVIAGLIIAKELRNIARVLAYALRDPRDK